MRGIRNSVAAMVVALAGGVAAHEAAAQPGTAPPLSNNPARRAEVRKSFYDELNRIFNGAVAAQKRGDCIQLARDVSDLAGWPSEGVGTRASAQGVRLPLAQRQEILRRRDQLVARLRELDCPPGSGVQVAQIASQTSLPSGVVLQLGAGVSVLKSIRVENGGLGGDQDITSTSFELSGQWGTIPLIEVRVFGEGGKSENGVAGQGTVATQANGGTQVIQGAGPVSANSSREAEFFRIGGDVKANLPGLGIGAGTLVPFFGAGFEHSRLQTELFLNWQPINFSITESTDVTTNRAFIFIGAQHNFANIGGVQFFTRGRLNLNLDVVDGAASYHTMQFLNFDETVFGDASRTALTFGGRIDFGAATTFTNGVRVQASAFAGFAPVWQWENRIGQPGTVTSEQEAIYGAFAEIRIPIMSDLPFFDELSRGAAR